MKKRFLSRLVVIFAIIFLLTLPSIANADVVHGNDFYYKNMDKTKNIGSRRFIINSPAGYVIPKEEPGSEKGIPSVMGYYDSGGKEGDIDGPEDVVFVFKNGEIFTITATYLLNGEYWGVMLPSHRYQPAGWVLMDDLLMIYDRPYFEAENKDNFYKYTGSYDAVLSAKKLVEWQWPGSDREKRIVEDDIPNYADVLYAYKDREGREWGKTSYTEWWICLSDPENSEIPAFYPARKLAKWAPGGQVNWSTDAIIWPPADLKELRTANKPQSAFANKDKNEFFLQHKQEAQELERHIFYVNGPDGYVSLRAEPGLAGEVLTHWALGPVTYLNGEQLPIDYVYNLNGEYWAFMGDGYFVPHPPGWIAMDHLLVMYSNDDFVNEHKDEFYAYTGAIRWDIRTKTFVLWEWPGSDKEGEVWASSVLDERTPITKNIYEKKEGREWVYNYDEASKLLFIENAYKDEEGREWIYIETYWNRFVKGWLCVNDPANREIPAFNAAPPPIKWSADGIYDWTSNDATIWPPTDPPEWIPPNYPSTNHPLPNYLPPDTSESLPSKPLDGLINMPLLIVSLVVVLLAGTVVLIWVLRKPHKNNKKKEVDQV